MPTIEMDDVNAAADAEYEPCLVKGVPGGDVTLLPVTRLSKAKREALFALDDEPKKPVAKKAASKSGSPAKRADAKKQSEDAERVAASMKTIGQLEQLIGIVSSTEEEGKRLLDHLDGDIAKLSYIVKAWVETTKPGEAEPSPS